MYAAINQHCVTFLVFLNDYSNIVKHNQKHKFK